MSRTEKIKRTSFDRITISKFSFTNESSSSILLNNSDDVKHHRLIFRYKINLRYNTICFNISSIKRNSKSHCSFSSIVLLSIYSLSTNLYQIVKSIQFIDYKNTMKSQYCEYLNIFLSKNWFLWDFQRFETSNTIWSRDWSWFFTETQ